jgi:hypothetical protein
MISRPRHIRALMPLLAAALLGATACTGGPTGLLKLGKVAPGPAQAPVLTNGTGGSGIIGNNTSTLTGQVLAPTASLVSNHGAGLIANNSGGLVSNNGSGLVGNNAGGFRVTALEDKLEPLSGAVISVTDAQGRPLSTGTVTTDAQGRYSLKGLDASALALFVRATRTQGAFTLTLLSIVATPGKPAELRADLDPVSTLVAKKASRLIASGKVTASGLNPEALADITAKVAPSMSDRDLAAAVLQADTEAEKTFDALLDRHPDLKASVGDVAQAAQTPRETDNSPAPTPTATPRRSSGGGGSSHAAPTSGAGTTVSTTGLHSLVRLAGDDVGGTALGTSPLTAGLGTVNGMGLGPDGTLYVADGALHQIRMLPPGAPSRVIAGAADGGSGVAQSNVPAGAALLNTPVGLLFDGARQALVVCDSGNNRLRAFTPGGRIYTIAGGGSSTAASGSATSARLDEPWGLAADTAGNLYFSERGSGRVRKLAPGGALTTVATLTPGAVGAIALDPVQGCLWVADGDTVRAVSDLAGTPTLLAAPTFTAAGASPGRRVAALTCDSAGLLYVLQTGTAPAGRSDTLLWRLGVEATGAARAGRSPEIVAGTGGESVTAGDYSAPTSPLADARDQLLASAGECGLALDLRDSASSTLLSGQILLGHSFDDGATRWGQVLRLEAVE